MSVEEREALARAANRLNPVFTYRWGMEMPAEARAAAKEAGIVFVEPDASLLEETEAFAQADKQTVGELAVERFGLADAPERVARFDALVDKWTGLLDGIEDPAEIAGVLQAEIWNKVDFSSYGD